MNVLFVCSDNTAASVIAEAILDHVGKRRFSAFSAGVRPAAAFNPLVVEFLAARDLHPKCPHPRSWREFTLPGASKLDFVITLGQEPVVLDAEWPGRPVVAHWILNEPIDASAAPRVAEPAIRDTFWELMRRIKIFASLRLEKTTRRSLQQRVEAIHAWQ